MFTYNISKNADVKEFKRVCSIIESNIKEAKKEKPLMDVDGTIVQIYDTKDGKIKVYNDYDVDAVYVDAEVNLSAIL
jgi:hypothetical protein